MNTPLISPSGDKYLVKYLLAKDDDDDIITALRILYKIIRLEIPSAAIRLGPEMICISSNSGNAVSEITLRIDRRELIIECESELIGDLFKPPKEGNESVLKNLYTVLGKLGFSKINESAQMGKETVRQIYTFSL